MDEMPPATAYTRVAVADRRIGLSVSVFAAPASAAETEWAAGQGKADQRGLMLEPYRRDSWLTTG
jgi:hypothetical protein